MKNILAMFAIIIFAASCSAQGTITLDEKDAPVRTVLEQVFKQSKKQRDEKNKSIPNNYRAGVGQRRLFITVCGYAIKLRERAGVASLPDFCTGHQLAEGCALHAAESSRKP